MNQTQISCFLEVAKCLSFTEAASRLHMSQPAISRNISNLEDELGFLLFIRENKKINVRLSPGGSVMVEGLSAILKDFEGLVSSARRAEKGESGKLSVGFLEGEMISGPMQRALNMFSSKYFDVEVILQKKGFKELIDGIYDESIDIALTLEIEVKDQPGIVYDRLFPSQTRLVVKKDHPLAAKDSVQLSDFKNENFICLSPLETKNLTQLLQKTCEDEGFKPNMLVAPDLKTQLLWLEAGRGVAGISTQSYVAFSPCLKLLKVSAMRSLTFVTAWKKENYNPSIALYQSCYQLIK